jgi:hypothetical protein
LHQIRGYKHIKYIPGLYTLLQQSFASMVR